MNIWVAGMPGSGKSTVGRLLAERVGRRFVDADGEIERRSGRSLADLVDEAGEAAFREVESEVVRDLAAEDGLVVGCGGGAVLDPANRRVMQRSGTVIFLQAPLETLSERIRTSGPRPLVGDGSTLEALWSERAPAYAAAADHVVDATGTPEEVAARVAEVLA